MFERFTEKARRVIFFARHEVSEYGGEFIDTRQLLLGLLREDKQLFSRLLREGDLLEDAAESLGIRTLDEKVGRSVDIPLSLDATRALAFGAEESEQLGHRYIDTGHLLLGLLREPSATRDLLVKRGLELSTVRAALPGTAASSANRQIVDDLRVRFGKMMARLKPELEPAVVYNVRVERAK